jgi:UDP-glucose 4-epimerase/UDP-arabinose 4-epimerase
MTDQAADRPAILVAGGAGYIGSQTCKALSRAGYLPVTLDNLSTGYTKAVKWGPFVPGDLNDRQLVADTIRQYGIKGAIHFAAFSLVGESVTNPLKYYANNTGAAVAFTQTLVENGVEAFVFSSTAAVYGVPQATPIPESHPTNPINPYGASKLAFESALKWIGNAHPFRWAALRYFNAAGADPEGETGESHEPESHLIPNMIKAQLGTGPALTVFGEDYPTPDGTPIRDYIHVVDLAEAHVLAIRDLMAGGESAIMNVGTGEGVTVKEMIAAAERVLGLPVPRSVGPRRAGDPPSLVADSSLLKKRFGWAPKCSDLDSIIRDAALWQRTRQW